MEAFKVFATLSLVDLMSNPLAQIRGNIDHVNRSAQSLSARFGNLALSMAPLAAAGGVVLGAFGKCVSVAAGFEDQMAKVGAVSRASATELQQLEARARELGGSTQFTASQVGQAEQYLAMAGFSVKDNIEALPGVLNLAAATATDLGRAADISSDIMSAFGIKASEMGHVADVLTAACNNANTNMEMLGETMKYVGPVAKTAGLSLEETATMAGILANSGIKASQGGTVLRGMLNRLAGPTKEAAKTLQTLGVTTQDAAGNLKKPITILREMAAGMKGMGNAAQMSALKKVFGEEAMAGVSVLLQNANGDWNKLFDTLSNVDGVAQKTADAMNDTLAGDMRGLGSAFESAQITIGKIFIPVLRKIVQAVTSVIRWFDKLSQSPLGKFFMQIAAVMASAIVGITAFAAAMWGLSALGGMASKVFLPLKAAIMAVSAPMLVLISIAGALFLVWKNDFGGIATVISGWGKNIRLVFSGIIAVFQSLKSSTGEIKGELAKEIKAAGLVGLVTTIGKVIYRIREFFKGIWDGLNLDGVVTAFAPAILKARELFDWLGEAVGKLFGWEVESAASSARGLGEVLGGVLSKSLELVAAGISVVVNGIDSVISFFRMIAAILTGDFAGAAQLAGRIWDNLVSSLMSIADALGIRQWLAHIWNAVTSWIQRCVDAIKNFCSSILNAITGAWGAVIDVACGAWDAIISAIMGAWDAIIGGIAAFGQNIVSGIAGAWDAIISSAAQLGSDLLAGISGTWDAVVSFIAAWNPVELIAGAFAGLTEFFASFNFTDGLQAAWDAVLAFFDGLSLFESGSKLLSTFIDGIMSMAGGLVETVSGVLGKIRSFLPFSDAKEGPLSTLTLSGSRMMTTLAEGVNQGKTALTASVSGALGEAGKWMSEFDASLNPPEMQNPAIEAGNDLQNAASALKDVSLDVAVPNLPDLQAAIEPVEKITVDAAMPQLPGLRFADVDLGQFAPPKMQIPEAPAVAAEDTVNDRGHHEGKDSQKRGQTITITIQNIHMPDVADASGFVKNLQAAFQAEIGALEGMA